ncbi:hypothetical protein, partial [Micromonospora sp. KC213]|uniref:VHL beta domain-containing protein n=1 Tax=Micromonospora sp. KC213 TaxID=2530378 RepID=UPI0010442FE2
APTSSDGPTRTLVLGCLAVGVVATLVFALAPLWSSEPRPGQGANAFVPATGGLSQDPTPDPVSATEDATFSPAPASLSTRATAPSPTQAAPPGQQPNRPAPTTRPSSPAAKPRPPKPPAPKPEPPRMNELPALSPAKEPSLRSSNGGASTYVEFVNSTQIPVAVFWLDHNGQRKFYKGLWPGQSYRQQTFVGHPWVVTDRHGRALVCFLPARETSKAVIR